MRAFLAVLGLLGLSIAEAQAQLVDEQQEAAFREIMPLVDDQALSALLAGPDVIFYTEKEMPRAYQKWDGDLRGVHSAMYNISGEASEAAKGHGGGGNGNVEFPWDSPGGTHRCENMDAFRFMRLPRVGGETLPVVWFRTVLEGDQQPSYSWVFPIGTVFGEVLTMHDPRGYAYAFELRTRTRTEQSWVPDVLRPFSAPQELSNRIKQLRPEWEENQQLAALVQHLDGSPRLRRQQLQDRQPELRAFRQKAAVDELPPAGDDELIRQLLRKTTFRTVHGVEWRHDEDLSCSAPTTQAAWHIVPADYDAAFISVGVDSCMRCHNTVNRHVDDFDGRRDWYGRIRGADRIFSFHPFALSSISPNGSSVQVRMRAALVQAGALEKYEPARHTRQFYTRPFK